MSDIKNVAASDSDRVTITQDPTAAVTAKQDQESKEAYVRRQAYEEMQKDMHKFKDRSKEAEARAAEYEAKLKSIEEQKLKDEQRYQELYEREKQERAKAQEHLENERQVYMRAVKLNALKTELGGNIKDEYLSHASVDSISINDDGTLSSESVREVANKFRQDHPMLIPSNASGNITNFASPSSFNANSGPKSLDEMSYEEKAEYLKQLKNN